MRCDLPGNGQEVYDWVERTLVRHKYAGLTRADKVVLRLSLAQMTGRKKPKPAAANEPEQYQLFDSPEYTYRVYVTDMKHAVTLLVWFYDQRAGAENLIKEANNDAGLAAYPSGRWLMNCNHFQLVMLAYNLSCRLMPFNREEEARVATLKHTTLATARLRFLFLAAKIWRYAGRVGVSYSDHYAEQGIFRRLMDRLQSIVREGQRFRPVLAAVLKE